MSQNPFLLPFDRLPITLPLFPLPNAVVMPGCQLPLNIFEPRYLNMVFDVLGGDRLIGMVQIDPAKAGTGSAVTYRTGTAGRISSLNETNDGRLLIVLSGVCRFDIVTELPTTRGYRRSTVEWSRFHGDYDNNQPMHLPRSRLLELLREYFACKRLETDWQTIEQFDDATLCNVLTGVLPFEVAERQTLVETISLEDRAAKLAGLLEFAIARVTAGSIKKH